jgi:hypothetical protein
MRFRFARIIVASPGTTWFETREVALLTMRVRSIAKRCVSKDEAIEVEVALVADLVPDFTGDDVAEQLPAHAVEPHQLHLLNREIVVR